MNNEVISNLKREYILSLAREGKRLDKRGFSDYRDLVLETGVVEKAEGSAYVSLGNTKIIVGVKIDVTEPYPDIPEEGVLTVGAELIPMASPTFEAGPPREDAVELARVVDRGIRESKAIDIKKLCLKKGELVRILFVDIHVLDYDGNLIDASGIAAMAALLTCKMKALDKEGNETGKIVDLPVRKVAVPCTFAKIGEHLLLDPSLDEERAQDSRITITTEDDGRICAMQKGDKGRFKREEVLKAVEISLEKGKEIRKLIYEKR